MKKVAKNRPFHFLRWFSLLSFFSITLISALSAMLLSRYITNNILQRDAVVTKAFVQTLVQAENGSNYFHAAVSEETKAVFESIFSQIANMPEVARANVYDMKGTVIWSDEERLIGGNFMPNPDLIVALSGTLAVTSGESGKPAKGEHVLDKEVPYFEEIYIPILKRGSRSVVGVFEIYKVPLLLFKSIQKGTQLVWTSAVLGGIFLYASLFWIARRASHVIAQQQAQLLEAETMAVVGEMASAVAHGIRNPLASIRSSAELSLEEDEPEMLRLSMKDIISEVDRLAGWIRELLSYSRISNGAFASIALNDLIRATMEPFEQRMREKHVKMVYELEAPSAVIEADEVPFRQMLISLAANALEAMPEGGELMVQTRRVKKKGQAEIRIIDTGVGISESQMKQIFKPYFTTKQNGIGVGLALAKRIMERHRGEIHLMSKPGKGTTVLLRLPAAR